jgi:hypothetical protein
MDITPGKEIVKPAHKTSNHFGEEFKHWFDGVHFKLSVYLLSRPIKGHQCCLCSNICSRRHICGATG